MCKWLEPEFHCALAPALGDILKRNCAGSQQVTRMQTVLATAPGRCLPLTATSTGATFGAPPL
jgi:hypothetical protein